MVWKLQSLVLSAEARGVVFEHVRSFQSRLNSKLQLSSQVRLQDQGQEGQGQGQLGLGIGQSEEQTIVVPGGGLMLEALTPRLTRENIDSGNRPDLISPHCCSFLISTSYCY